MGLTLTVAAAGCEVRSMRSQLKCACQSSQIHPCLGAEHELAGDSVHGSVSWAGRSVGGGAEPLQLADGWGSRELLISQLN